MTRKNSKKQPVKRPQKGILASATIRQGIDTDILQEDLIREFQPDRFNTDESYLINGQWVRFFDPNSSFLKGLMALINNSTTLRNVIQQKTSLTMGEGFNAVQSKEVPFLQTFRRLLKKLAVTDNGIEEMNSLISSVNLNNETLEEVIEKAVFDWWAFGNSIVELVKGTRQGKEVVYLYHVPLYKVAIKKANENNIVKEIGISENWENQTGTNEGIRTIPLYPEFNTKGRTAIHIKQYSAGFFYWGLPENVAGRFWAEIEYRIPKYNISKFKNGFVPSAILQFFGSLTQEEAKKLVASVEDTFTDTGRNSKMLVQVLRDEKYKLNAQVLEDKNDGNYMDLQALASQAIVTANRWTMSLAGLATAGKLGSNQQIRDELDYVINTSIKQARRKILQSIVNPFVKENALLNPALQGIMLEIANMNPVSLASYLDPKELLLQNEQRQILGFDALDTETQQTLKTETEKTQNNGNSNNFNSSGGNSKHRNTNGRTFKQPL